MLELVKLAKRVSNEVFDPQFLHLISAAIDDLKGVGAEFDVTEVTNNSGVVSDYIVTDPRAKQAIITYVLMNFSPSEYADLKASYDEQKAQMRESSDYGMVDLGGRQTW